METKDIEQIKLVKDDPWLEPFDNYLKTRLSWFEKHLNYIEKDLGGLDKFSSGHKYYGFNYDKSKNGYFLREYAPSAESISLIGDFNSWDANANPLIKKADGVWEIFLPDNIYKDKLIPFSKVKLKITSDNGTLDRIPAYIKRVIQDPKTFDFSGQFIPESDFKWTDSKFKMGKNFTPIVYEAHTGMATEDGHVGTWREFADNILPKIIDLGYNTIQLMAVQEHPYYGSFGYHVSNFFSPSSRFGTPDDLRYLINKAHNNGIAVIMDIVHSHSVKNISEGLREFDGKKELYFVDGPSGWHPAWDSKLFDYGKMHVQSFLLSNIKYWLEDFHFDGFRFDGITSMLYYHHGHTAFCSYDDYFGKDTNNSAVLYLQMANELISKIKPEALSIAEDMSGMPGACRPIKDGGLGFTHRLAMGLPDFWIKLIKNTPDEDWNVEQMYHALLNRRHGEKNIAYCESHDQALVGDKTLAFWLMDKEMYTHMSIQTPSLVIDRGIALHKMIRFITLVLGGEAYLNFMGNEFGHPEWIDFPREGNNWSSHYARRQWSLAEKDYLKYQYLLSFDKKMIDFSKKIDVFNLSKPELLNSDNTNKALMFKRGDYIFIFNFSTENSIEGYEFFVPDKGEYQIVFSSDNSNLGGFSRVKEGFKFNTQKKDGYNFLSIYLPNRMCMVLKKI